MKAHELFQHMPAATAAEIFEFLKAQDKDGYKAAIEGLANKRNLRAVFVTRKPAAERHAWMQAALSRPANDTVATHIVQAWLLRANTAMLCDFLAALEIAHDEDGTVEDLPACPPKEKIAAAVALLLGKYPPEAVAIYLHAFRDMDSTVQWPVLNEIIAETPALRFA